MQTTHIASYLFHLVQLDVLPRGAALLGRDLGGGGGVHLVQHELVLAVGEQAPRVLVVHRQLGGQDFVALVRRAASELATLARRLQVLLAVLLSAVALLARAVRHL